MSKALSAPNVESSGSSTPEHSPPGTSIGSAGDRPKGRQRLLDKIQRISSSPSLKIGRPQALSYRRGERGSISCISLSSTTSAGHGAPAGTLYSTFTAKNSTAPPCDRPISAFDSACPEGIRIVSNDIVTPGSTTHISIPLPMEMRPSFKGRGLALTITPEISEECSDYFSKLPHPTDLNVKKGPIDFWKLIPGEIKMHIFQFLTPREIVRCSGVSKSWHKLCFDGQLWQNLDASAFYTQIPAQSLDKIISAAGPFIKNLNLRGCVQLLVNDCSDNSISKTCRNLVKVSLEGCCLDRLSMHYFILQNNRLVHLNLSGLNAVSNNTCRIVAQSCLYLEYFNISWCPVPDSRGIQKVINACSRLKDLRVAEIRGMDDIEVAESIFRTNNLERLVLNGCESFTDIALAVLCKGTNSEVDPLTQRPMVPARKLKHLDLSRCEGLTDKGINNLAHNVPNLEGLQLGGCKNLTDVALHDLIFTVPKLTHLDLEDLPQLTNATLQELAKAPCKNILKNINISYCEDLGDAGILPVIRSCPNLQNLDLDNTRISDLVLTEVAEAVRKRSRPSRNLAKVGMRIAVFDCQSVTWAGVREVLSRNAKTELPPPGSRIPLYPSEVIQLKCFYGWQMTVDEHQKRVLRGDLAAASKLEHKWAEYMMATEDDGAAGARSRRRRRRVREAALVHADEEGSAGAGHGRRRRARSGPGCVVM
ncbi:MAG: hypothetical protein M1829_001341 [Trizodia sp. TS-e1964]|nr:MAG: hypothetical protein M1829_001341 [Trizodia sp. TS-e1964]